MKRIIVALLLLSGLLIFIGYNVGKNKDIIDIDLKLNVLNLNDEEFERVGTKGLEDVRKDDFKYFEFNLDVKNSRSISNRTIKIPDIHHILKDKGIFWGSETGSQNNESENFAEYYGKYLFLSRGLDEQEIRNIFSTSEVKVSWTTSKDENKEAIFNLGEIVEFK